MSDNHTQRIVNKAWSFAHLLRDDGLSYMEYTEQITFLLFLKMAHERTRPPWSQAPIVPDGLDWPSLLARDGADLESHYRHVLTELSRQSGMLGEIFRKARQEIQNPATLKRLIATGIFYAQGVKANVLFFDAKPAREKPWTERLWVYDLRTNKHFTLKMKPLRRSDLDDFVACYRPGKRHLRKPTWHAENPDGRWRAYDYDELVGRDKLNLDLSWLRDRSLEDSENLPEPEVLAAEIVEDLRTALEAFEEIAAGLTDR